MDDAMQMPIPVSFEGIATRARNKCLSVERPRTASHVAQNKALDILQRLAPTHSNVKLQAPTSASCFESRCALLFARLSRGVTYSRYSKVCTHISAETITPNAHEGYSRTSVVG